MFICVFSFEFGVKQFSVETNKTTEYSLVYRVEESNPLIVLPLSWLTFDLWPMPCCTTLFTWHRGSIFDSLENVGWVHVMINDWPASWLNIWPVENFNIVYVYSVSSAQDWIRDFFTSSKSSIVQCFLILRSQESVEKQQQTSTTTTTPSPPNTHMHAHTHARTHTCTHTHACMHACTHTRTHTHTHENWSCNFLFWIPVNCVWGLHVHVTFSLFHWYKWVGGRGGGCATESLLSIYT